MRTGAVEDQVWEQDQIRLERGEFKVPLRWPVVKPRVQVGYMERARHGRSGRRNKGNCWPRALGVGPDTRGERGPDP